MDWGYCRMKDGWEEDEGADCSDWAVAPNMAGYEPWGRA